MKSLAILAGFDNVHDWLIHNETGESAAALVLRKWEAPFAKWLNAGSDGSKDENGVYQIFACSSVARMLLICVPGTTSCSGVYLGACTVSAYQKVESAYQKVESVIDNVVGSIIFPR